MSILLIGAGKSGTSAVYAAFSCHSKLTPLKTKGDSQNILSEYMPKNSVAKIDTHYIKDAEEIRQFLKRNSHVKIVWIVREVKDVVLSKLTAPFYSRKENPTIPEDGTKEGCLDSIQHAYRLYADSKDLVTLLRFEDFLKNPKKCLKDICSIIGLPYCNQTLKYDDWMSQHEIYVQYNRSNKPEINKWEKYQELEYNEWLEERGFTQDVIEGMFDKVDKIKLRFMPA